MRLSFQTRKCLCEASPLRRIVRPNVGIPRVTREVIAWLGDQGVVVDFAEYARDAPSFGVRQDYWCSYSGHWLMRESTQYDVLTIHDCREIEHPEWSPHDADVLKHRVQRHWSRGGRIHVLTRTVEQAVRQHIGSNGQIVVARLDPLVAEESSPRNSSDGAVGILGNRPFLIVVGSEALHKGYLHLLDCWMRLPAIEADLVLVGSRSSASHLVDAHPAIAKKNVHRLGDLPDSQKFSLMRSALAVVAPSMHEGLGLVPVEALQLEVPLIASSIAAHIEVAGDSAHYFRPGSDELIERIVDAVAGRLQKPSGFKPQRDYAALSIAFGV